MRIATWNINGLRARFDFLVHWLRARRPDVVALQEVKLEEEQFPADELAAEGYRAACHGQKAWNGVALLSRWPLEITQRGLPGQEEMGARLLTARTGGITMSSVYVPNGKFIGHDDFPHKLAWLDALHRHLAETVDGAGPCVVGGDFNLCPAPLDSWNEKEFAGSIFHTDEERELFRRLLGTGLVDLYRELAPEGADFSWWDYRMGAFHRGMGLRIDFLLASPDLRQRTTAVLIDREYRKKKDGLTASDHAPVIADLDLPTPG